MSSKENIEKAYDLAKERYAEIGVDTEKAIEAPSTSAVSSLIKA